MWYVYSSWALGSRTQESCGWHHPPFSATTEMWDRLKCSRAYLIIFLISYCPVFMPMHIYALPLVWSPCGYAYVYLHFISGIFIFVDVKDYHPLILVISIADVQRPLYQLFRFRNCFLFLLAPFYLFVLIFLAFFEKDI